MAEQVVESVQFFLDLAQANNWADYDAKVLDICNDSAHIDWATETGLTDSRINARDLAISIFEQTSQPKLTETQAKNIANVLKDDENLHLRRKAAFVLFKHGDRTPAVIDRIKDAAENDPELKDAAKNLLDN